MNFEELEKLGYKEESDIRGTFSCHFKNDDGDTITIVNSLGEWLFGKSAEVKTENGFTITTPSKPLTAEEIHACNVIIERLKKED